MFHRSKYSFFQVTQSRVHADGKTEQMDRFQLSGEDGGAKIACVGNGLLAASTSDRSLRFVDILRLPQSILAKSKVSMLLR